MRALSAYIAVLCIALLPGGCARARPRPPAANEAGAVNETREGGGTMSDLTGKTILMVIAHANFRDEELAKPKAVFEKAGATVRIASSQMSTAKGMLGATATPDLLLKDAKASDYDAIVFVGGGGASEYWNDAKAHALAKEMYGQGKVVSAICIAPVTLANAGLLQGKKATVWKSEAGKLRDKGANYTGEPVTVDGRIVTADGPTSAAEFGNAVVKAIASASK
jgi:protease I